MIHYLEPRLGDATFPILDVVPPDNISQVGSVFSFTVTSWSMFPTIQKGDVLTIESPDRIRVGDLVVYASMGALVCHRITQVGADGTIRTRGDAAHQEDTPIPLGDVIGRVTSVLRGSRRIVPATAPARATMADRARMQIALFRASVGERLVGSALNILARLKRTPPVRAVAMFLLARHVRFYLGVRVPVQSVQAYRFVFLAGVTQDDLAADPSLSDCLNGDDIVIQARLGRLHLGTFHPASDRMHVRLAVAGLGLEEQFHGVHQRLAQDRPAACS